MLYLRSVAVKREISPQRKNAATGRSSEVLEKSNFL
jgi:hypothetical protein